eukprot:m.219732 g.219732  ORF g.219732 m.219732 type:complete len:137 (-) comp10231_c0_seq1:58-468(-)
MRKFLTEKKVVILLNGRYAGKKAVIVKSFDDGDTGRLYGHALVAGIDRTPLKVLKSMSKKKIAKRSKVKTFLKVINFNHVMPTRYSFDAGLDKAVVSKISLKDDGSRRKAKTEIKKKFEQKYKAAENKWFFSKLRF